MKVFCCTSTGASKLLNEEEIFKSEYFSKLEKEVLIMFHNWKKVGFAVKYRGTLQERREDAIMQYSVLFLGSEDARYSIPIGLITIPKDECNVSKAVHGVEELIQTFFNTVCLVKKQSLE